MTAASDHRFGCNGRHRVDTKTDTLRRFEVITGVGRRRRWSAAEKARIVAESLAPGASVSAVARRHGLHPNQLFAWRRLVRADGGDEGAAVAPPPAFVPVLVDPGPAPVPAPAARPVIEVIVGPVIVRLDADVEAAVLARVLDAARRVSA